MWGEFNEVHHFQCNCVFISIKFEIFIYYIEKDLKSAYQIAFLFYMYKYGWKDSWEARWAQSDH